MTATEPFLNLLHTHAVCQQQAGAAVSKIVKPNSPHIMLLQHNRATIAFNDVASDAWYTDAMSKALSAGVLSKSATQFDPNGRITREEMVVMLMRAYGKLHGEETTATASAFDDESQVSAWAVDAVRSATALQLISGRKTSQFEPRGITTRAEAVTVLMRLLG